MNRDGGVSDRHREKALLLRLRSIAGREVLWVGSIPAAALASWQDAVTTQVVITAERRRHYLQQHPEIEADEALLLQALVDPDEVHANAQDARMAIIYQQIEYGYFLRVPMWVSNRADRQNSVLSLRRARRKEVEMGRHLGRVRWKK